MLYSVFYTREEVSFELVKATSSIKSIVCCIRNIEEITLENFP